MKACIKGYKAKSYAKVCKLHNEAMNLGEANGALSLHASSLIFINGAPFLGRIHGLLIF